MMLDLCKTARPYRIFLPAVFLLFFPAILFSKPSDAQDKLAEKAPDRVTAIGDVHGDFDNFSAMLKRTGLIDAQHHWTGGKSVLVQTGDLIDRGAKGREVMDLLISLEKEAPHIGGQVVALLGNHEIMNLLGDLRYVSTEDYAHFADAESEKRRKAAYQEYAAWLASHAEMLAALRLHALPTTEEEWMAKHPPGFLEHCEAFGPTGMYGKWIRSHAAIVEISGVIFLHGGIHPVLSSMKLDEINRQIQDEIQEFDRAKQDLVSHKLVLPFFTLQEIAAVAQARWQFDRQSASPRDADSQANLLHILGFGNWMSMREDGPLWFRSYDQWSEEEGIPQLEKILAAYGAKHIVVGHTVQQGVRIRSRFAGRVFLIDTGMLSTYWRGGRASALEIRDARKFVAVYLDSEETLFEEKPPRGEPAGK
jgi:hypothetical protein